MGKQEKEIFWRKHFDEFTKSNLSRNHYCRVNSISPSTFQNWFYKFHENPNVLIPRDKKTVVLKESQQFSFVELKPKSIESSVLKIQLKGVSLEMTQWPDVRWVSELLRLQGDL